MKNILILDPYKKTDYRISKDTSGGYGTGNDFGDGVVAKMIKRKLKSSSDWPPLFLAYSFSVLKKKFNVSYKKIYEINEITKSIDKFDLFIISSSIVCSDKEIEIIKELKNRKKIVVSIGPFATNLPNLYLSAGSSVISGEPEMFFLNEDIENIRGDPKIYKTSKITDINLLPYPEWQNLMDFKSVKLYGKFKSVPILATRGCPYSCFRYCVYPLQQGRAVRQRSPDNVMDEIMHWHKNFGVDLFIFRDPVFSINKKHTIDVCNKIIESKIKIKIVIETHLRLLSDDLILKLKSAGLIYVKVGVENADTDILSQEKRFTVKTDAQLEVIKKLKNNNIKVSAMYILGYPSDNEKSINNTINYSIKLNTDYAQFSIWTPYPGTPAYKDYENKVHDKRYHLFDQYRLVYQHSSINKFKMRELLSFAYRKYYLRFKWIFNFGLKKIYDTL